MRPIVVPLYICLILALAALPANLQADSIFPVSIATTKTAGALLSHEGQLEIRLAKDSQTTLHLLYCYNIIQPPDWHEETLRYTKSTDDGQTWSTPVTITELAGRGGRGSIRVDNNDVVHIVYHEAYNYTLGSIYHIISNDHGDSWSVPHLIGTGYATNQNFAFDSNNHLYVIYTNGGYLICKKSTDGGITWADMSIPNVSGWAGLNSIQIGKDDVIHVACCFASSTIPLYYMKSDNHGVDWTIPEMVGIKPAPTVSHNVQLIINSDNVIHLVQTDREEAKAYYFRSLNGGPFQLLSQFSHPYHHSFCLVTDRFQALYAYYMDNNDLFVQVSLDRGQSFGPPQNLTNSATVIETGLLLTNNEDIGFIPVWVNSMPENYTICMGAIFYPTIDVIIDIKPGSYPNSFNNDGHGVIPIAILGSENLDVNTISVETLRLESLPVNVAGKSNKYQAHFEFINDDEYLDLVIQFEDIDGLFSEGTSIAKLTGNLNNGILIEGYDEISIIP